LRRRKKFNKASTHSGHNALLHLEPQTPEDTGYKHCMTKRIVIF